MHERSFQKFLPPWQNGGNNWERSIIDIKQMETIFHGKLLYELILEIIIFARTNFGIFPAKSTEINFLNVA